jgi:hypothetical protein
MDGYKRGDKVLITDYPLGRPLGVRGTIVGILDSDTYNVLLENGCNEGRILKFKFWSLIHNEESR